MVRITLGMILSMLLAVPVRAQAVTAMNAQLEQVPDGKRTPRITITLDEVALDDAIRIIGQRSGRRIIFVPTLMPNKRVTYRGVEVTAERALTDVLAGTGVQVQAKANGSLVLVRGRGEKQTAAHGTLRGLVIDAKTKQPLAGASVTLEGTSHYARTGNDGLFRLSEVAAGSYALKIRMLGYVHATKAVTVQEGISDSVTVTLEPSASQLDQVVVTGTIVETSQRAVPTTMTVFTAKQIEERGITSIDELFRGEVPGLYAQNTGPGNSQYGEVTMFARGSSKIPSGFNASFLFTNAIKTYVDGIELADSRFLNQIDPRSIERIEILSGPQASTIYGSEAINGVMQIFTKKGAGKSLQWTAVLSSGFIETNYRERLTPSHDYSLEVRRGAPGMSYAAGVGYRYQGQWIPNYYSRVLSGFASGSIAVVQDRLTIEPSVRLNHHALGTAGGFDGSWYIERMSQGILAWAPTRLTPYKPEPIVHGRTLGAVISATPVSMWQHRLTLGTDAIVTARSQAAQRWSSPSDTLFSMQRVDTRRTTIGYNNTLGLGGARAQATLTSGADYGLSEADSYSAASATTVGTFSGGTPSVTRSSIRNTGYYGQGQLALWNMVFLTAGLRAEDNPAYGREYGLNYTPRYGASFVLERDHFTGKLRIAYGKATRPPAVDQRRAQLTTDVFFYGGIYESVLEAPLLGPEYQRGGEGGLDLYLGNRLNVSITRYRQVVDDMVYLAKSVDSLQTLIPNTLGVYSYVYQSQYRNIGSVENAGWEGEARMQVGRFSLRGTWSNTQSRIRTIREGYSTTDCLTLFARCLYPGRSISGLAEHSGSFGVTYTDRQSTLALVTSMVGQSTGLSNQALFSLQSNSRFQTLLPQAVSRSFNMMIPGFHNVDIRMDRRVSHHVRVFLNVQNALNAYDSSPNQVNEVIGRTSLFGVRVQ